MSRPAVSMQHTTITIESESEAMCRHRSAQIRSKFLGIAVSGLGTSAVLTIIGLGFGMWPSSYEKNYYVVALTSLFGFFLRAVDFVDGVGTVQVSIPILDKKLIALATLLSAIVAAGVQGVNCFWMSITAQYSTFLTGWTPVDYTVFALNIFATITLNLNIVLAGHYIYRGF